MLLSSPAYFTFLVAIFFAYWLAARYRFGALAVIVFANYFFYARWDLVYLALIPAASTCDFFLGQAIDRAQRPDLRRLLVTLSIILNVGLIASVKYVPVLPWTLPLALSFYAFQSLTYTIDIYRRDAKPATSYLAYLASASFFPTTLAGPITRIATLLPQWSKRDLLSPQNGGRALFLIGLGLVKKFLIADFLAENLVNRVFDLPKLYSGAEVLAGVYGYALQLYYDFSGYTDIAIGSALSARHHATTKLQSTIRRAQHLRFLAPLAHVLLILAARLPLLFIARSALSLEDLHLRQSRHHHDPGWPVARRRLDLRGLGRLAWRRLGTTSLVAEFARQSETVPPLGSPLLARVSHLPLCSDRMGLLPCVQHGRGARHSRAMHFRHDLFRQRHS